MFDSLIGKKCVLWWSGGNDSTLLLSMLREQNIPCDIVQIREFWTRAQKRRADDLIKAWKLKVFSFPAMQTSFIGKGDEITAVFEYAVGNAKIPLLRDVIGGDICIANLKTQQMPFSPMDWDVYLVGSRKNDRHYAFDNQVIPSERWEVGGAEIYAPLFEKSREWVLNELKLRGLPSEEVTEQSDTGNLSCCNLCLNGTGNVWCPRDEKEIDSIIWDRELNLKHFRNAYS